MTAFLDLFSPPTYQAFTDSDQTISGFRIRHRVAANRIAPGDQLLCYMTKLSRWVGILEVESTPYEDSTPLFYPSEDPFIIRFKVKPLVWLPPEQAIPIKAPEVWPQLSFTKDHDIGSTTWTGKLRTSLNPIENEDASLLKELLHRQIESPKLYELSDADRKHLITHQARRTEGTVIVTVPDDDKDQQPAPEKDFRESIKVQAALARLGADMGMRIWLPRSDRSRVLELWNDSDGVLLNELPLNYDTTTLQTIENIDVIWMKRRAIVRAFEVDHTTAIYSGILRMADLLALQPNMDIRLHIVAPESRHDKVTEQLRRPVFSLLERQPLWRVCSFLSYEQLDELCSLPHINHLSDTIIDEYADDVEDSA